jgi:hypothetical protein
MFDAERIILDRIGPDCCRGEGNMHRANRPADEPTEYGPVYLAIERALWALGPALVFFLLLNFPAVQAARQQAEADVAADIGSENLEYCAKWGMPVASPEHADCVQDLVAIRARTAQRVRDQAAAEF